MRWLRVHLILVVMMHSHFVVASCRCVEIILVTTILRQLTLVTILVTVQGSRSLGDAVRAVQGSKCFRAGQRLGHGLRAVEGILPRVILHSSATLDLLRSRRLRLILSLLRLLQIFVVCRGASRLLSSTPHSGLLPRFGQFCGSCPRASLELCSVLL
jgi:hypothetical protein